VGSHAIDDATLEQARLQGDPFADSVVAALFESGRVGNVGDLLALLVDSERLVQDGAARERAPAVLRRYLDSADGLAGVDPLRVARGEAVFVEYAPEILLVLAFYSLPASYAARNGVQVLLRTGYLHDEPLARVFATAQRVVDLLRPGGLGAGGRRVPVAQRVRLIHAAVRYQLRSDARRPWPEELGLPINQEDMAGTLMTFSFLVLDGLEKLQVRLTRPEREDFLYLWVSIGRLLGIREDLLPPDMTCAEALTRSIYRRQIAESVEGKRMTRALIQGMTELLRSHRLEGLPAALIRHFLRSDPFEGRDIAALLGVPPAGWAAHVVRAGVWVAGARSALGVRPRVVGQRLLRARLAAIDAVLKSPHGGPRAPFDLWRRS
jgi:mpaB/rubber oxygenase-like protein